MSILAFEEDIQVQMSSSQSEMEDKKEFISRIEIIRGPLFDFIYILCLLGIYQNLNTYIRKIKLLYKVFIYDDHHYETEFGIKDFDEFVDNSRQIYIKDRKEKLSKIYQIPTSVTPDTLSDNINGQSDYDRNSDNLGNRRIRKLTK